MKKIITKHIEKRNHVKVFVDDEENSIANFNGLIFEQNDKFILMCDMYDFFFDGFVIIRKSDITEIKYSDNEKFIQKILDSEKITDLILQKRKSLDFSLDSFPEMFSKLLKMKLPVIIECKYGKDNRFLIGPVAEIQPKKVKINYFNTQGEFDFKPVSAKYKEITFFKINDPYAETFFKYTKAID